MIARLYRNFYGDVARPRRAGLREEAYESRPRALVRKRSHDAAKAASAMVHWRWARLTVRIRFGGDRQALL